MAEQTGLVYIIPDMEKTYKDLEYFKKLENHSTFVNRTRKDVAQQFSVCSSTDKGELIVRIPLKKTIAGFKFGDKVKLVNPRLLAERNAFTRGGERQSYAKYHLAADDIVKA